MRLSLSQQYIDNLKLIGLDLNMILELANLPDTTWKEELNLSTLDYYHLLTAFDKVATDEQIIAMSRIKDIQMFMPLSLRPFRRKMVSQQLNILPNTRKSQVPLLSALRPLMT